MFEFCFFKIWIYFFYLSFFFSILFFCCSFLEWDSLKSCVFMCFGVISMSCYMSLGMHVWYSYFVVLIFLSGLFSLITYFCSISGASYFSNNYSYFLLFLFFFYLIFLFFFDYNFFSFYLGFNFLSVYYDFSYYCVFWIVFVLFLFLNLLSYSVGVVNCYMRGLWYLNSFTMSDYGSVSNDIWI